MSDYDDIDLTEYPLWGGESGQQILEEVCAKHSINPEIIGDLAKLYIHMQTYQRRPGMNEKISEILSRNN